MTVWASTIANSVTNKAQIEKWICILKGVDDTVVRLRAKD
jgi:hypothetical protein